MNVRCISADDAEAFSALSAFSNGVHRVNLQVYVPNEPALELYKSIGFVECGAEPEAVYLDGQYYDGIHMTLVKKQA